MKNLFKYKNRFNIIILLSLFLVLLNINLVYADIGDWETQLKNSTNKTDLYVIEDDISSEKQLAGYIGILLRWMPFLGIALMIHFVLGGYEWMTAAGDKEKVEKAKKRLRNVLIGSIILIALYIIAYFFVQFLSRATGYRI